MLNEGTPRASSTASTVLLLVSSVASATPATDIHRPDDLVSAASANHDTVVLPPVGVPTWLAGAKERLMELGRLPDDWGGSEKPNGRVLEMALAIIKRMERLGHRYLRIAPMADGGIAVRYLEGARSARFDIYNEGEIVVATREGSETRPEYKELPETDAVDELSQFLQHVDATSAG